MFGRKIRAGAFSESEADDLQPTLPKVGLAVVDHGVRSGLVKLPWNTVNVAEAVHALQASGASVKPVHPGSPAADDAPPEGRTEQAMHAIAEYISLYYQNDDLGRGVQHLPYEISGLRPRVHGSAQDLAATGLGQECLALLEAAAHDQEHALLAAIGEASSYDIDWFADADLRGFLQRLLGRIAEEMRSPSPATFIHPDALDNLLWEYVPTLRQQWTEIVESQINDAGVRLHFETMHAVGRHIADLYRSGDLPAVRRAFDLLDLLHREGDYSLQNLATDCLVAIQVAARGWRAIDETVFEQLLSPTSRMWWGRLNPSWQPPNLQTVVLSWPADAQLPQVAKSLRELLPETYGGKTPSEVLQELRSGPLRIGKLSPRPAEDLARRARDYGFQTKLEAADDW